MRILVVDDDPMVSEMIAAMMEGLGHEVVLAENAIDGGEKLDDGKAFALIVSDMNMPLVSGIEFCEGLRAAGNTIPFILLTGDAPESLPCHAAGVNAYVVKDFDLDETLPRAIATVLAVPSPACEKE